MMIAGNFESLGMALAETGIAGSGPMRACGSCFRCTASPIFSMRRASSAA